MACLKVRGSRDSKPRQSFRAWSNRCTRGGGLGQKRAARWRVIHDLYREWQGRLKARAAASPEFPFAGLAHLWPPLLVRVAMESGETPPSRSSVGYRDHSPKQRAEKGRGKREQKNMQLLSFLLDLFCEKQPELVLEHGPPDDYKKYKYRGDRGRKPPGSIHIGHRSVSVFAHSPAQVFPAPG